MIAGSEYGMRLSAKRLNGALPAICRLFTISYNGFDFKRPTLQRRWKMGSQQATQEHEAHIGETKAIANHDHDLIHEMSKRLDGVWRYDQYIANAEGNADLQNLWKEFKRQDQQNVERLKDLIRQEIKKGCF